MELPQELKPYLQKYPTDICIHRISGDAINGYGHIVEWTVEVNIKCKICPSCRYNETLPHLNGNGFECCVTKGMRKCSPRIIEPVLIGFGFGFNMQEALSIAANDSISYFTKE
jgi:hypothetical protein